MYKPGGTIADALDRIQKKQYVLPAIQREFVWQPEQIERLFDSLMQGYPFGTFLFWRVEPTTSGKFKFFDFVLNYHQRDAAHCPDLAVMHNQTVTAVLDGQQRLTALNIGLRGSMAKKAPYKWWNSPDAFPRKTLCLNLLAPVIADEEGARYSFRFLTEDQKAERHGDALWFRVSEILGMKAGPEMLAWLIRHELPADRLNAAFEILDRLYNAIHNKPQISYYEEEGQDIERVLNIFIRLNSGGTVLSYSDLLLSVATAQWKQLDARAEVHRMVDELNRTGAGFGLSKDFVLKAGLMLADINSVGFKVENFTAENMAVLEAKWPSIRNALLRTVELAASFGMSQQTLRADSALLPIAYYLHRQGAPANYVVSSQYAEDRSAIRQWLVRSLLKASGIWGSGLDTLLTALRDTIGASSGPGFPAQAIRDTMRSRSKSLRFDPVEIDDMLDLPYGNRRTFPLLSLLFPFVDLRNQFHVDHVFPISRFQKKKLKEAGLPAERHEELYAAANSLSNLQLLEGTPNMEKQATMPAEWLRSRFPDGDGAVNYRIVHALGEVPESMVEFETFLRARRELVRAKLLELLIDEPPADRHVEAVAAVA